MKHDLVQCQGCNEYQEYARRRDFFARSQPTFSSRGTSTARVPRVVLTPDHMSRDTLVLIFLRGGVDSLTTVPPYGDPNLYSETLRANLAIPPPGDPNGALDLDGFFGLHPTMGPLLPAFQDGKLAIVHATGSPDPTRSHFDAFNFMEYGIPLQPQTTFTGWLARHLEATPPATAGPLRAVAVADLIPRTLAGAPLTLPIADPALFGFPGRLETATERRAVLEAAYAAAGDPLAGAAQSSLETIDLLTTIDFENYTPAGGAVYPDTTFGDAIRSVAAMIKAQIGLEVAMVELGSWDTHAQQVGPMLSLMADFSGAMGAFHADMQDHMNELTMLAMSEFGRRADMNSSSGTDHGHGSCMFAMGGNIAGGQVMADWTSGALLHPDLLYQGDSLEVTTDYRDIVAEILETRLENTDLAYVFPNFSPTFRGITSNAPVGGCITSGESWRGKCGNSHGLSPE